MLAIDVVGSSSSGNCYVLRTSKEILLLECGMPYAKLLESLNHTIKNVIGCLISHEHKDHSAAMKEIVKAGINIYTSAGTLESIGIKNHRTNIVKSNHQFEIGSFSVLPFTTEHDAKEPLGFLIQHDEFGKLLFATDSYYLRYKFIGLNYIMIECNYSHEIISENLKRGIVNKAQISRLLQSHFSLERVKQFLTANNLSEVKEIMLLHLSDRNSNAEKFKSEIEKLTGIPVRIC